MRARRRWICHSPLNPATSVPALSPPQEGRSPLARSLPTTHTAGQGKTGVTDVPPLTMARSFTSSHSTPTEVRYVLMSSFMRHCGQVRGQEDQRSEAPGRPEVNSAAQAECVRPVCGRQVEMPCVLRHCRQQQ